MFEYQPLYGQAVQLFHLAEGLEKSIVRLQVQVHRHRSELHIQINQQGASLAIQAINVSDVARNDTGAGTAFCIDDNGQVCCLPGGLCLQVTGHPVQGGCQILCGYRQGKKIPGAGLHCHPEQGEISRRTDDQGWWPATWWPGAQGGKLFGPQVTGDIDQCIRH